ncbi:MAG: DUF6398 domain-containing protein [Methanoregula sp.]|nr:DUF6398 domain-containing protein [Methanoregula sp.]
MIDNGAVDLKKEISEFIKDEILLFGTERGTRAAYIINDFSTSMCEEHKKKVSEWDIRNVRMCLFKDMAETPGIIREGGRGVVPVICRFLLHLHESGHLPDAINMVNALLATEPAFKELVAINEKEMDLFANVMLDLFLHQTGVMKGGYTNPDKPSVSTTISTNEATIRKTMIRLRCDEFCERFSDYTVSECCAHLVRDLVNHPESPLLRGDQLLWSAAIIYTACQRENLIRRGTGGSQLGEEIALFFAINLSSMRSKASAMKKYLVPTDYRGD